DPAYREGNLDPQVPLSLGRQGRFARYAAARGVGLQRRRDDAHTGNAHLSVAAEDREGSLERRAARDRDGRLSPRPITFFHSACAHRVDAAGVCCVPVIALDSESIEIAVRYAIRPCRTPCGMSGDNS